MTSTTTMILERPTTRRLPANGIVMARPGEEAEPNYALRRVVAGLLLVAVLASLVPLGSTLASFGGEPASAAEARPANRQPVVHVAVGGDTLWSIAREHRGGVDHDRYVDALIRLNGGSSIQIGQAIRLP